ncbi:serine/threonine protein kinase [Flindersiella endophytica]
MSSKDANVEGYTIEGLLGEGPLGELWLAREDATGARVTLRRVDTQTQTQERARRLLGTLEAIQHPNLLRVREMVPIDDDMVVVSDYAEGGTLEELLRVRHSLDPGEVVSFAAPISQALALAHRFGLAHGAVSPDAICFAADGTPLLADLGLAGLLNPEDPPQPSDDIYAMSAICYTTLTGLRPGPGERRRPIYMVSPGAPPGLAHVIEAGLQVQPQLRPDANELATQLIGSTPKVAIRLVPPQRREPLAQPSTGQPGQPVQAGRPNQPNQLGRPAATAQSAGPWQPPGQQHSRQMPDSRTDTGSHRPILDADFDDDDDEGSSGRRRTALLVSGVGVAVAIVLALTLAWVFTRDTDEPVVQPTSQPSASPTKSAGSSTAAPQDDGKIQRWSAVLRGLDTRRAQAFAALDVKLLEKTDVKDSKAYLEDKSQIDLLKKAGYTKAFRVQRTYEIQTVDDSKKDRVVLEVTIQPRAAVLEAPGGKRQACGTNAKQKQAMVLTRVDGAWLVQIRSIRDGTKRHPVCPPPAQPES